MWYTDEYGILVRWIEVPRRSLKKDVNKGDCLSSTDKRLYEFRIPYNCVVKNT